MSGTINEYEIKRIMRLLGVSYSEAKAMLRRGEHPPRAKLEMEKGLPIMETFLKAKTKEMRATMDYGVVSLDEMSARLSELRDFLLKYGLQREANECASLMNDIRRLASDLRKVDIM